MIRTNGSTSIGGDLVIGSAEFGEISAGTTVIAEISTDPTLAGGGALPTQKASKSYADSGDASVVAAAAVHTDTITVRDFGQKEFTGVGPINGINIGGLPSNQLVLTHNDGAFNFAATGPGTVRDTPPVVNTDYTVCSNTCTFRDIIFPVRGSILIDSMFVEVPMRMYACPGVVNAEASTIGAYAGYRFPGTSNATLFLTCMTPLPAELGIGISKPIISVKLRVGSAASTASAQFAFRYKCIQQGETIATEAVITRNVSAIPGRITSVSPTISAKTRGPGAVIMVAMTRNGATDASTADIYAMTTSAVFQMYTWGARSEDL